MEFPIGWIVRAAAGWVAIGLWAGCCYADASSAAVPLPTSRPAPVFSAHRISYDRQCFTIDGKDTLIFSGAFHYFRCPKPLWADRFAKLKAAGFNAVETYVAWDWHERTPPANPDDFSKLQNMVDLRDWLQMATQQFGFDVLLRPGPYICAEWDGGGYPQWLAPTKKPADYSGMWLRGDDPTYLAWCRHWYAAVAKVAAPFQITRQPVGTPGIILWQLENEYGYDGTHTPEQKLRQLLALGHDAREFGIDVPLFTCQTTNALFRKDPFLRANVLETLNDYPKYDMAGFRGALQGLIKYQPDKLHAISELQGGWFSDVGGKLSWQQGFSADQIQHITLLAWAHGFTSTNYYMGFGGTNFGDWAAEGITTTYDYDAPVHEDGGVTARYAHVAGLGRFFADNGPALARSTELPSRVSNAPPNVSAILRRSADGRTVYLFAFNDSKAAARSGSITIDAHSAGGDFSLHTTVAVDLPAFGSGVMRLAGLSTGPSATPSTGSIAEWLPRAAALPPRPKQSPSAIAITDVRRKTDPGPSRWQQLASGGSEESVGIYDRRYVFYRTTVPADALRKAAVLVLTPDVHDSAVVLLNGTRLWPQARQWSKTLYALPASTAAADAALTLIYENPGRNNGGDGLDAAGGFHSLAVVDPATLPRPLDGWRIQRLPASATGAGQATAAAASTGDLDDRVWKPADINGSGSDLHEPTVAVYRCSFDLTPEQLSERQTTLRIGRINDHGTVYVNGQRVAQSTNWQKPIVVDVGPQLRAGKNLVSVVLENGYSWGGLGQGASLDTATPRQRSVAELAWEISGEPAGYTGHWESPQLDDSDWQSVSMLSTPEAGKSPPGSLVWYRMKFASPPVDLHAWVPWHLKLDAVGNGFLFLNGHPLGRYWQVGPQHDFFLPACWMNAAGGQPNVVALCLRPTDGASVTHTEVEPDCLTAEQR